MWAKQQTRLQLRKNQPGFTIVELLIVIVVIGILAAIVIVAYNGVQGRASLNKKIGDLSSIRRVIESYYALNGSYPTTGNTWSFQRNLGDSFIPGVTPSIASKLPSVSDGSTGNPTDNSYVYNSNGTDYKIIYYLGAGIPADQYANVPPSMIDPFGSTHKDRYGFWSAGGVNF
jgi:prepilin-type N-terminal cleavage/methylation domain-containing protein